jgi:hypothetical protein
LVFSVGVLPRRNLWSGVSSCRSWDLGCTEALWNQWTKWLDIVSNKHDPAVSCVIVTLTVRITSKWLEPVFELADWPIFHSIQRLSYMDRLQCLYWTRLLDFSKLGNL